MKGTERKTQRERRESTQRLGRSEGDTIENNDNEKGDGGGGAEMERGEDRRGETLIHALIHIT